ncbi:CoA-binding protein [Aquimarina muelleri]|uniref:CoA-binding protein n=1 Tax=Aquimarina muelleri TaxID=279356 RepID=A0A918JVU9_9FLAO|nr:CoA-binding protein [Aquimarina muelleri]MCX2761918.1 CoA-binding protein [Aquimarina muelleri]GGX10347.1 CoA-binding protein [Aquimarina muelleri]
MNKKTLVLGASLKADRYSNMAINKLINYNHDVIAIGLKKGEVAGIEIQTQLDMIEGINTVTLYLNPIRQQPYYDQVLNLKPERVIFNPGTENPEFYQKLRDANIKVEIACTLVLLSTDQY